MAILRKNKDDPVQPLTFTPSTWRLIEIFIAELVGTAMLLFFGCMSQIVWKEDSPIHPWQGAVVFCVTVATIIQVFGHISSAHLNPAITVNFLLLGCITRKQAVVYVLAECVGAFLGFGLLQWVTPCDIMAMSVKSSNSSLCQTLPNPAVSDSQAIAIEFFATGCLILVNCGCADSRNANNGAAVSLKFAATILALGLAAGPYTGASLNPARTLGPAIWNGNYRKLWIYWLAPLLSGIVVTIFYQTTFGKKPTPDDSPVSEDTPLNQVKLQSSKDDLRS